MDGLLRPRSARKVPDVGAVAMAVHVRSRARVHSPALETAMGGVAGVSANRLAAALIWLQGGGCVER